MGYLSCSKLTRAASHLLPWFRTTLGIQQSLCNSEYMQYYLSICSEHSIANMQ